MLYWQSIEWKRYAIVAMRWGVTIVAVLALSACVPEAPNGRVRTETPAPDPNVDPTPDPNPTPNPNPDPDPDPTPNPDPNPMPNPDPNAVRFTSDVLPILERYCTECHDPGRTLDFTALPLSPAGPELTIEMIIAAAEQQRMPPPPRDYVTGEELDVLRRWRDDGLLP